MMSLGTSARLGALTSALMSALLGGGACTGDLPKASAVEDLRVLAVRAEPPQVEPGDTVTLSALIANPTERVFTLSWSVCIVPEQSQGFFGSGSEASTSGGNGAGLDGQAPCTELVAAGDPYAVNLGEGPTATFTVPADLFDTDAPLKIAYGLPASTEIPAEVTTGFLGIAGVNYTVNLVVHSGPEVIDVRKRVNVGLPSLVSDNEPNENPVELAFHIAPAAAEVDPPLTAPAAADGSCFVPDSVVALTPDTEYRLTPLNIPDPQAPYAVLLTGTSGEAFTVADTEETYFYSFFSTVGAFDKELSKSSNAPRNKWMIPADASGVADVWIVVRDGRGGTSWCSSQIPIVAP